MNSQLYFVYGCNSFGDTTEKRLTDKEHLETAIKTAKKDFNGMTIYVNKASFCFDGYLVQGSFCGSF